jgi:hypothetical protein
MMTVNYKLLHGFHRLYNAALDVSKRHICSLNSQPKLQALILRQHEILQVIEKPFPSDPLHIGWSIDIDGYIGKMFIYT